MCRSLAAAYSNALHIPVPWSCATPFSLKAHPLCLQYAELSGREQTRLYSKEDHAKVTLGLGLGLPYYTVFIQHSLFHEGENPITFF